MSGLTSVRRMKIEEDVQRVDDLISQRGSLGPCGADLEKVRVLNNTLKVPIDY